MSGTSTPQAGTPVPQVPKQMSSRLLTMKFMQKAANTSSPYSKPQTPVSEPSLKRRKTEHTPDSSGTTTPASDSRIFVDRSDVRAAIKTESALEALAAARRAELGFSKNEYETQWVLDVNIPAQNGAQGTDSDEESELEETNHSNGRQTYGSYKRKKKTSGMTPSSTSHPPDRKHPLRPYSDAESDDFDDEGEISEDDYDDDRTTPSQKKRKAGVMDLTDERAMSALDRVDLSRSSYAKTKGAIGPPGRTFSRPSHHPQDRRGEKHPKKNRRAPRNKKR